ncbi:hydroxyacid dehydrogenase [Nonomuraea sp. NPDC049750]|uniref:hydroxyacid dehydrogenase n=1 Tax=Nonomuraea sp. NPDC049750 TaxID=3154738 RepID=UPI0033E3B23C
MSRATRNLVYFESWSDDRTALSILANHGTVDVKALRYDAEATENFAALRTAHGYQIATRGQLRRPWFGDAGLLRACPSLLAITSTGSGYDMIDIDACTEAGVIVCNQTGSNATAVAEHAVGLMLAVSKKINEADRALRNADERDRFGYGSINLSGKTVGIIGLGEIGRRTAALCRGFGMRVLAHDPYLTTAEIEARGAHGTPLRELLAASDFVTVHCPRTDETMGMFDRSLFETMKPTAYFISTARGGVHDEDALYEALRSKRLAGAGLDVFLEEPPSADHPLLTLENVVATPHIAGLSADALKTMASYAATQWLDIFSGKVPPRLVNPEAWPLYARRFEAQFGFKPDAL